MSTRHSDNGDIAVLADFDSVLYEGGEPPLVSLYLPLHGPAGSQQDAVRFEDLLAEAKGQLAQRFEHREHTGLDARLDHLATRFGEVAGPATQGGLALFAGNDRAFAYRLGYAPEPRAVVADAFFVRPLLKRFSYGSHYLVLGLSADRYALIRGDAGSLRRVALPPAAHDELSRQFPEAYDGREGALDHRSLENHLPPYHGWKSRNDVKKEESEKFFRIVSRTVAGYVAKGTSLPVILASLPEHQALFRRISTIPTLLGEGIEKDVGGLEAPELLADAKAVIERERLRRAGKLLEGFGDAAAHGRATSDLAAIGLALAERRVRALFVDEGAYVPGGFDAQTGEVSLFERRPHDRFEGPELADGFARAALAQDAEVLELDAQLVPGNTGIAALLRY